MRVCPSYLSFILYNPIRKALTNRERVLDEAGIRSDSVVLEVGAGNGFFTEALARKAKKVYAVELQEGMVRKMLKRVGKYGDKVAVIQGDIAAHELGPESADVAFLYYCFHEVGDQAGAARNIAGAVKPGGIAAIFEPTVEVGKDAMQRTLRMFEDNGFTREAGHDGLFTRFARLRKKLS